MRAMRSKSTMRSSLRKTIKADAIRSKAARAKMSASIKKALATTKKIRLAARRRDASIKRKIAAKRKEASGALSAHLVSADIAKSQQSFVSAKKREQMSRHISLSGFNQGLVGKTGRRRQSRLEALRRTVMIFIRRVMAWISKSSLTASGKNALSQLDDLYSLISVGKVGGEEMLKLKVAYGEACYHVMRDSRNNYQKGIEGQGEDYQHHFDRFLSMERGQ